MAIKIRRKQLHTQRTWAEYYDGSLIHEGDDRFVYDFNDSITGSTNDRWRSQVAAHENATTAMSAVKRTVHEFTPAVGTFTYAWDPHYLYSFRDSSGLEYQTLHQFDLVPLHNLALKRAYDSISANFQGSVFLGELRETVKMIRNPAYALRRGVDELISTMRGYRAAFRKRDQLAEYRRLAGQTWLEYSWGWRPLVNDIRDAVGTYRAMVESPRFVKFTGRAKSTKTTSEDYVNSWHNGVCTMYSYNSSSSRAIVRYKGEYRAPTGAKAIPRSLGVMPRDWVPAAWELIPWSWAVDYFVNVGDILNAWATSRATDFTWTCLTERTEVVDINRSTPQGSFVFKGSSGRSVLSEKHTSRSGFGSLPLPSLYSNIAWNFSRGLNIASLAAQAKADMSRRNRFGERY